LGLRRRALQVRALFHALAGEYKDTNGARGDILVEDPGLTQPHENCPEGRKLDALVASYLNFFKLVGQRFLCIDNALPDLLLINANVNRSI
jgi:hypothetical protein